MRSEGSVPPDNATSSERSRICIAIAALGGQGGGVLTEWLVRLAESSGWSAQSTSVPGVAQRTGTTVYYVEIAPPVTGAPPLFALMPTPGDVDVVIGAELMEAGRAVLRGLVTPQRTTLIMSTHRVYGISEKADMGDGIAESQPIIDAARVSAKRLVAFDMEGEAAKAGCALSAVLFGAVAGSGVLPFRRVEYERTITDFGVAVSGNLEGFSAGVARTALPARGDSDALHPKPSSAVGQRLNERIRTDFPQHLQGLITAGAARLVEYLDTEYAELYLERLSSFERMDSGLADRRPGAELTRLVARHLALWMSYEDTFRVADVKTSSHRLERLRNEVKAVDGQIVHVSEYLHPRWTEVCESLPKGFGSWLLASTVMRRLTAPFFRKGRRIYTTKLRGFIFLWVLARFGRFRRGTLRYSVEQQRVIAWLDTARQIAGLDYDLALEIVECQRLVKGYGDTHERGLANFEYILDSIKQLRSTADPAQSVRRLRSAALADEDGRTFRQVCKELKLDN